VNPPAGAMGRTRNHIPDEEASPRFPPQWVTVAVEAAKQPGPYPHWVTGTAKAIVVIGVLTAFADWAAHRSAKAELARLVVETSKVKAEGAKAGTTRR
jgi:hypothetical protein